MSDAGLPDVTPAMVTCDDDPAVFAEALGAAIDAHLHEPVLVVDMSRGDGVRSACERRGAAVRYVAAPDSRGISDSRNRVAAAARTRYVLFVDADAIAAPGWAAAIRSAFDRDGRAAVVGARCLARWRSQPPRLLRTAPAGDFLSLLDLGDVPLEVPRVVGTSFAIDRERMPSPAPFDLSLGIGPDSRLGGEEVDLCERVRAAGWHVLYEPEAVVLHDINPERATWGSMLRRAYAAGREGRRLGRRLEPLPRELTLADRAFQAATAPAFLAGAAVGARRAA
jgi:GT2 family glycosyltransferase